MAETIDTTFSNRAYADQLRFAHGLARFSQALLEPVADEEQKTLVLNAALEQLRQAAGSSRSFLYKNFDDPELGFCSGRIAGAHDPLFPPDSTASWLLHRIPWSVAPEDARLSLEAGRPFGGVVDEVFATTPDFLQALKEDGVLSVQFFPVHVAGIWWGYMGFDDRQKVRQWAEAEITLLGTAAEMIANAFQRWQTEANLRSQNRHEEALSSCSRALLQMARSQEDQVDILHQALEYLRSSVNAGRAYLLENFTDPELGLCTGIRAEVCASGVHPQIDNPANQRFPWSKLPPEMRQALEAGKAFGGPVKKAFVSSPRMVRVFESQQNPLLSVQLFPIQFGERWWGFIGFDDVEQPRQWSEAEVRILRIASEMIGNTLQRWQTESALRLELDERRRREERLRLLESVVVNTAEAVIITEAQPIDPPGPRILYVNEAFTKITGYSAEEVIGQSPRLLQGPRTSRQELDRLRTALEGQEAVEIELINYRKDGSQFWVEMSIAPVLDVEGNCTHFVAVQRDATERRQAEEALRAARNDLEIRVAERTSELVERNEQLQQEIGQRLQAEAAVRKRLSVEQTLAEVSSRLVIEEDPRHMLPAVLHDVAKMVDARRVALVFLDDNGSRVGDIYEWCSPDTQPLESIFLSTLMPAFAWMRQQLEEKRTLFFDNLNQMPSTAAAEKQIIREMGTESMAAFPLHVDGRLMAVMICSNFVRSSSEIAHQLDILNVVSGLLGSVLQREALLDSLEQRVIDRTSELAAFYDMTMLAGGEGSLSDILVPALDHIMEVTHCQAVSVHELSADGTTLSLVAQHGLEQEMGAQSERLPDSFGAWFGGLNEPIIETNLSQSELLPLSLRPDGFEVFLGAQLRARGRALGLLSCYRQIDRPFSLNTTSLAVALAEQLGIIIENYRLRQQAEQGAIIGERQRLARDLHDAITQSLYGVTLFARSSADALEAADFQKMAEMQHEVERNALYALKEMRLLLHQLQPLALEQGGLLQAIESRLNQVERRLGIQATLAFGDGLTLRPRAKETVYRIITEALNNSLKHANANEVSVSLQADQGLVRLEVKDNGCGFDPAAPTSGMGITNMKERTQLLQGDLTLTSTPGQGTILRINLPREWLE